ncbi:cation:proton antiporter [Arthrobacter sp. M4]|uniref:cation:proton antiporter n=1 Tax=Arthrobacter sp. M4 TaxID=218160 RepID=UPI001CDD7013|nr:cation:proton antiporter [Arthrobacter sp. M4]MCA4134312.1 cation:proton antiporter [Arthrobacter sp. M4]
MGFLSLALIALVALLGPLLALPRKWHLPVVLGELLAGIAVGRSGLRLIDSGDPTLTFLADLGFALLMFVAGTHVPILNTEIRKALGHGAIRAAAAGVLAAGVGSAIAAIAGTGNAPLYVVLLASSSAALVLPIVDTLHLEGPQVLRMLAHVAIADTAAIIALPLAIDPPHVARAALGTLAVAGTAVVLFAGLWFAERTGGRHRLHEVSEERKFALELRIQLALLFTLAGLATLSQVSIMLAGFSFGLAVAAIGEPRRLARQLFALSDGFLTPVFFVWLGASLDLGALAGNPGMIALGLSLGAGAIVVHTAMRLLGAPLSLGVMSAAQLGVPAAAVTVGTHLGVLHPGEGAALLLGALVTIAATAVGGARAARRFAAEPVEQE